MSDNPTLPQGYQRFSVEQLLIDLAPEIGLRPARLHALLYMMKQTAPGDWNRADREPIYFAPQDQTAAALGKTRRALYNDEHQLEALGLIEKRVKDNGTRSPFGGCGIVFSRLIARVPDFLAMRDRLRAERALRKELKNRRSTYMRFIRRRLPDIDATTSPRLVWIAETFASWPSAQVLHTMPLDRLEAHLDAAKSLCEDLEDGLQKRRDSSARPAENFPSHLQKNTEEDSSVICNASDSTRRAGKPAHSDFEDPGADAPEDCLENKHAAASAARNTNFMASLTPQRLFDLASPDMQALIRDCQGSSNPLRSLHFIDAAARLGPMIGINPSAWARAVQAMGDELAACCVLVLDANRTHPTVPVRNPGGALRAMTARHVAGKLNLVGSLIGLSRRRGL